MYNRKARFLIWSILLMGFQFVENPNQAPLFFSMTDEWRGAVEKERFVFNGLDSLDQHEFLVLANSNNQPLLYYSDLQTAVCADGECRLASLKIYWNLLGNYVGYGIHSDDPLTKYDHDPFTQDDYDKLHRLFLDNNSVLRQKTMYDLVDKVPVDPESKDKSNSVDGMSSATKKNIADAVVKGGLYSCYTLWHLIHGEAKEKMKSYLKSIESDSLNTYFLYSDYKDYQLHALKYLSKEEFTKHPDQIGKIFLEAQPMTRTYILKKIPDNMLAQKQVTQILYNEFETVGINSRTQLINRLHTANNDAPDIISNYLSLLTRNQLKGYLDFLEKKPEHLNSNVKSNLRVASKSKEFVYRHLIKEFFRK